MTQTTLFTTREKSPGVDGISVGVVKAVAIQLINECLAVMNAILMACKFIELWQIAQIILIEKLSKRRQQEKKYQLIYLLNVMAKLLERLLPDRLKIEVVKTGSLAVERHGFKEGKSIIIALQKIMEIEKYEGPHGGWRFCALITVELRMKY